MEERKIKVLAAAILILGLLALAYIIWDRGSEGGKPANSAQIEDSESNQKSDSSSKKTASDSREDGSKITITGKVAQVIDRGKVSFLKMSPASKYQIVSFDKLDVEEGSEVEVTGKVQTYKGKKEVIIDKISVVE